MKKTVFTCGTIAGLISTIWFLYSMSRPMKEIDFDNGMIYGFATMILAFSLIFVGIKNYRDRHQAGTIRFGKAFLVGLYITLIASTIYVMVWLVDYYVFIPDFGEQYSEYTISRMRTEGATDAEIAKKQEEMQEFAEMYKNPIVVILFTYLEILPVGLLISIIAALILKRKPGAPGNQVTDPVTGQI